MRLSRSAGLLVFAASANAIADSSPFVLLSTGKFTQVPDASQLQTSTQVLNSVQLILDSCPTERYHIVSQPNLRASDIRGADDCKTRKLCSAASNDRVRNTYSVAEVVGKIEADNLSKYIQAACSNQGRAAEVQETALHPLPSDHLEREKQLAKNDQILDRALDDLLSSDSYTIIYLSSPAGSSKSDVDSTGSISAELKKLRARAWSVRRQDNSTDWNNLPLFEKYQFLTPGIFHGIVVTLVILSILGVGLRALSSLEVSYGAFDKEMGPAAQKKQN
ncbi:BIG1-domain-containing protein [Sodiomyces alkalinus F11]|uniref:Protein BIG1 n=1 Tax=Sodiomyces alkalinus (strain CBS 110278 / VKM F-3762 / F11) TaxID=1314773 RepID=A0A3N2Q8P7_SODAK|nr:BIG1-domain-containing protein [Sodiomyces alkalinus F11]ROT43144.1 BIG1-domain-containing protein [Sodiomyces alkalinus F11]